MKKSISIIQMSIEPAKPEENRRKALKLIENAAKNKPDIIVLPEMWTTAYELEDIDKICDKNGQPTMGLLKEAAVKHNVNIVAGSYANLHENKVYNTSYIINRNGSTVSEYRKLHLFKLMQEDKYITAGDKVCIFELEGIKCGLIICYDLRFPELTRRLALNGIKILFVPAQWPTARVSHWITLLKARAIENQIFIVAVNVAGKKENDAFPGCSAIIDPWGEYVIKTDYLEQTANAVIDMRKIDEVKEKLDVLSDRVPELY